MRIDAQKRAGTFKGDVLVEALGPEHPGRTRGVSSTAPWKTGRDWKLEDKRATKKTRKEKEQEKMKANILKQLRAELTQLGHPLPPLLRSPAPILSSCASREITPTDVIANNVVTTNVISFPCDHIEVIKPIDHAKYSTSNKLFVFIWHPT